MRAKDETPAPEEGDSIRQMFLTGRFPVATVDALTGRPVRDVLGLVVARGYDPEETFYGMLSRAAARGAQGIVGYRESVSFHPDGSRFYTCYGTAVRISGNGRFPAEK